MQTPQTKPLFKRVFTNLAMVKRIDGQDDVIVSNDEFCITADNGKCRLLGGRFAESAFTLTANQRYTVHISNQPLNDDTTQHRFDAVPQKTVMDGKPYIAAWTDGVSFRDGGGLLKEGDTYYVGVTAH